MLQFRRASPGTARAGASPVFTGIDPLDQFRDGANPPPWGGRFAPTPRSRRCPTDGTPHKGNAPPGLRPFAPETIPRIVSKTALTLLGPDAALVLNV